jgi:6-pyruvoyltetrahydropterin/6-carboxytetrahydropterin synthase
MISHTLSHQFCAGHRTNTEASASCSRLHGHTFNLKCTFETDGVPVNGTIVQVHTIKSQFFGWIDKHWNQKMILWNNDPLAKKKWRQEDGVVIVSFDPTTINMALYLFHVVAVEELQDADAVLVQMVLEYGEDESVTVNRMKNQW